MLASDEKYSQAVGNCYQGPGYPSYTPSRPICGTSRRFIRPSSPRPPHVMAAPRCLSPVSLWGRNRSGEAGTEFPARGLPPTDVLVPGGKYGKISPGEPGKTLELVPYVAARPILSARWLNRCRLGHTGLMSRSAEGGRLSSEPVSCAWRAQGQGEKRWAARWLPPLSSRRGCCYFISWPRVPA